MDKWGCPLNNVPKLALEQPNIKWKKTWVEKTCILKKYFHCRSLCWIFKNTIICKDFFIKNRKLFFKSLTWLSLFLTLTHSGKIHIYFKAHKLRNLLNCSQSPKENFLVYALTPRIIGLSTLKNLPWRAGATQT